VRLLALWPLLAYCASLGWQWRWLWRSRWNVDWQGKPKFSERKPAPAPILSITKIPHDETRVGTRAAAVGRRRLLFFYLFCEAIGTAATPGLLCQPRVIVKIIVEKQMECRLAGRGNRSSRIENLPQRHFCPSRNPTWPDPGLNPGRCGGKPVTNRLSYGAAVVRTKMCLRMDALSSLRVIFIFRHPCYAPLINSYLKLVL
jgi:hypothetical protein